MSLNKQWQNNKQTRLNQHILHDDNYILNS